MNLTKHSVYFSIDSGGILGVIPAELLRHIEEKTKVPIYQLASGGLMGTSTGAIISSLLSVPAKTNSEPFTASEVLDFYKTRSKVIFTAATRSLVANFAGRLIGKKPNYDQAKNILESNTYEVFQDFKLNQALTDLFILTHNKCDSMTHVFSNKTNITVKDAVCASASIADAFGPITIELEDGSNKNFVDAASIGVKPNVCDPTYFLYQIVSNRLTKNESATIYSLGTGFSAQQHFKQHDNRICVQRIQPDISHLVNKMLGYTIGINRLAADTSPEAFTRLLEIAEKLKESEKFKAMLLEIQTNYFTRDEL